MIMRTSMGTGTGSVTAAGVERLASVAGAVTVGPEVAPGLEVAVGEAVGLGAAHDELSIVSWIIVTAPLRASARPSSVTPLLSAIEVRARIVPLKLVVVSRVAELPTCQ